MIILKSLIDIYKYYLGCLITRVIYTLIIKFKKCNYARMAFNDTREDLILWSFTHSYKTKYSFLCVIFTQPLCYTMRRCGSDDVKQEAIWKFIGECRTYPGRRPEFQIKMFRIGWLPEKLRAAKGVDYLIKEDSSVFWSIFLSKIIFSRSRWGFHLYTSNIIKNVHIHY